MDILPGNKVIRLQNRTCPYCGIELTKENRTREHVIGRSFVPRGTLHQHFNLIVWACEPCNRRKAALEDDISAVSMQPTINGEYGRDDQRLRDEAARKAQNCFSRRSKKRVADSKEEFSVTHSPYAGVEMTLNMESAPQADEARIIELATLHLQAFFYWATYTDGRGRGWSGKRMFLPPVRRADWGNPQMRHFMATTAAWEPTVFTVTAEGYFALFIRRGPSRAVWSFALEWNESYRIVGYLGDEATLLAMRDDLPLLPTTMTPLGGEDWVRWRAETPLAEEDDILFQLQDTAPSPNST
jgi:hypothetical protein